MDVKSLLPFGRRELAGAEDPFTAMRREMDRMFDEMTRSFGLTRPVWGEGALSPRIDVKETEKAIEVQAELPGVTEKDVELQFVDNVLTIKGEKKASKEEKDKDKGYYLMERSYGSFLRRIPMPCEIDEGKVEARFAQGVLSITLPKSPLAEAKAKKIEIRSA